MAEDRFIWYEIENEDAILRRFDLQINLLRLRARDLIDDLADAGKQILDISVPEYSSYTARHVDREPVQHSLTSAGGEWSSVVGIKRGTSQHPLYAEFGTGIYAVPARGYIVPANSEFLSFFSTRYGRRIKLRRVRGQRAQRYFYQAWLDLNFYARARVLGQKLT